MTNDAPLQVLMHPFATGALAWPQGDALFLHARAGWALREQRPQRLVVEQSLRPLADALAADGYAVANDDDASAGEATRQQFELVLLLPPRQRDQARTLLARALQQCSEDGIVVAAVANESGAKSLESDLRRLAGGLEGSLSKAHCRVLWARKQSQQIDTELLQAWCKLDAPRHIVAAGLPGDGFMSRPGVFAWDRIDPASALLAAHLPTDLTGHAADLGAGWGYLSIELLRRNPGIAALDVYEADARALTLARINLAGCGGERIEPQQERSDSARPAVAIDLHWHDVTAGLSRRYDVIVSNPPFHAHDRGDRPELGQRFIEVAAQSLQPGGRLYLVANRHLPYEAALATHFRAVKVLAQQGGFKVVEALRASA